jgi:hypothetical protein
LAAEPLPHDGIAVRNSAVVDGESLTRGDENTPTVARIPETTIARDAEA